MFLVFRVSRRPSNTRNNYFYRVANQFYHQDVSLSDVLKWIDEFIDGGNVYYDGWYDLNRFADYLLEQFKKEKGFYSWNGLRYFLYEYELHLQAQANGNSKVAWEDLKENSIEHIYPQEAKDSCWTSKFRLKGDKKARVLHSLGNLLLLSKAKNSELQNKCFSFKKKHKNQKGNYVGYFNGSYSEIEVAQYPDWNAQTVYQRGVKLLEFMEDRWQIKIADKKKLLHWLG